MNFIIFKKVVTRLMSEPVKYISVCAAFLSVQTCSRSSEWCRRVDFMVAAFFPTPNILGVNAGETVLQRGQRRGGQNRGANRAHNGVWTTGRARSQPMHDSVKKRPTRGVKEGREVHPTRVAISRRADKGHSENALQLSRRRSKKGKCEESNGRQRTDRWRMRAARSQRSLPR